MHDVNVRDVVEANIIGWGARRLRRLFWTSSGYENNVRVGSRSDAEAMVRRLKLRENNTAPAGSVIPFPKDVAAS